MVPVVIWGVEKWGGHEKVERKMLSLLPLSRSVVAATYIHVGYMHTYIYNMYVCCIHNM